MTKAGSHGDLIAGHISESGETDRHNRFRVTRPAYFMF
jgi:hypothetical protein